VTAATAEAGPGASDLRLYTVAQVASTFGSVLTSTAVAVAAVVVLHAGAHEVSLIVAGGMVPPLVLGPVAGVLRDRATRPRRMLIRADLVAAVAVAACAVAAWADALTVASLAALSCTLGVVRIVVEGLYFSHLRTMQIADLGRARGTLQSTTMLSRSAGASLGGPLVAAVGTTAMFVGDVLTYLFSTCCLLRLKSADHREVHRTARPRVTAEFLDGMQVLGRHSLLAAMTGYLLVGGVAAGGIAAQRAVFLLNDAELPVALYGVPAVAATLLGAVGALVAPRALARGVSPTRMLLVGEVAAAAGTAALPMAGGSTVTVLMAACVGTAVPLFFGSAINIALVTVVGEDIGDGYFARVSALISTGATLANLLGALLGGVLGERIGARAGIWAFVGLDLVAVVVLAVVVGRRSFAGRPAVAEPVAAGREPAVVEGVRS
jgi:MFS family permease